MRRRVALLGLALAGEGALAPQASRAQEAAGLLWMSAWSPLGTVADLPRRLTTAPDGLALLLAPPPRVGPLWTAGNPGGAAFDVADSRSEFRLAQGGQSGDYRRPLDPTRVGSTLLSAASWQPVGSRGSAVGRVVFDQEKYDPASWANLMEPYASSPIVTTDSTRPALTDTRVRLEGVLGWRFGPLGIGVAPGYEVRDARTVNPRLARLGRNATAAAAGGLSLALPWAGLRLGAMARYSHGRETLRVIAQSAGAVIYPIYGYSEPDTVNLGFNTPYYREALRDGTALGFDVQGELLGATWSVYGRHEKLDEAQTSQQKENPAQDTWKTTGWTWGGAARREFPEYQLALTAYARSNSLTGRADRFDLNGAIFRATESALEAGVEARLTPLGSPWSGAALIATRREARTRNDFLASLYSDVTQWSPGGAIEVARALDSSTSVAFGLAYERYFAAAAIPNPTTQGPLYQMLIGPELSVDASSATAQAASLTLRRRLRAGASLWFGARYEQLGPSVSGTAIPLLPGGSRRRWSLSAGAVTGNQRFPNARILE